MSGCYFCGGSHPVGQCAALDTYRRKVLADTERETEELHAKLAESEKQLTLLVTINAQLQRENAVMRPALEEILLRAKKFNPPISIERIAAMALERLRQ